MGGPEPLTCSLRVCSDTFWTMLMRPVNPLIYGVYVVSEVNRCSLRTSENRRELVRLQFGCSISRHGRHSLLVDSLRSPLPTACG